MRKSILAIAVLVSALYLSSVLAAEQLSGDAIRGKLVGNTVHLITDKLELAIGVIQKDGSVRGSIGGKKIAGTWTIKDGANLCFDLPDGSFDLCRAVFDHGNFLMLRMASGDPSGRMEVLKGNPYKF